MSLVIFAPFFLQACAMFFDELYFHRRRGLPLWERLGHQLDTLSVLAVFSYTLLVDFSEDRLRIYLALASFSCLLVIKDEFIHYRLCSAWEMVLHGFLFILHPLVFLSLALIWQSQGSPTPLLELSSDVLMF